MKLKAVCAVVLLALLAICSAQSSAFAAVTDSQTKISADEARSIAFSHAKVADSDVRFYKSKLEWDHGRQVYNIEFISGAKEYEYEVDADSGEIIKWEVESIFS